MQPSELAPVKIGFDDGMGNVETVIAFTAEQVADALESAMDAENDKCYSVSGFIGLEQADLWRDKIKGLRLKE